METPSISFSSEAEERAVLNQWMFPEPNGQANVVQVKQVESCCESFYLVVLVLLSNGFLDVLSRVLEVVLSSD